jgi:hypothetical protein
MPSHPFSKVIHTIWFQGHHHAPIADQENVASWQRLNSSYEVLQWDYQNLSLFIRDHYPQYFEHWNRLDRVIKKCDFARLLLIDFFGGVYVDLDLRPKSPIDVLLDSGKIRYGKTAYVSILPTPEVSESVDLRSYETLFSREYQPIDSNGFGLANGVMVSVPRPSWVIPFIDSRIHYGHLRVLDYMGPHALTRFFRERKDLQSKVRALPPYYFLWERSMQQMPPEWVVSCHPAVNSWGDSTRVDFWNV